MDTAVVERPPLEKKPSWLRAKIAGGEIYTWVKNVVKSRKLHTVCESAQCPNLGECWNRRTATFMILGNTCTRSCGFCAVNTGRPTELDIGEPARVADAVFQMKLKHVVITSVARDDLKDGGAAVWAATIRAVKRENPETKIEVLIPDFKGKWECLDAVLEAKPHILNHNVETVPRLHRIVRPQAKYERSLEMLDRAKKTGFLTKTGMMLGIGEWDEEIDAVLRDLSQIHVDILTLGQYLRPSKEHLPLDRWVTPEEFANWKQRAFELGFRAVESGPLVRSSYHADEQSAHLL